jgi:hypothetical protein
MQPSEKRDLLENALAWVAQTTKDAEAFEQLFVKVLRMYDPESGPDVDNSIGNLTLLDEATNRSYKNAIFAIKRSRHLALDKGGIFVPLCTKNVFLKYYSAKMDNMLTWSNSDSAGHRDAIIDTLVHFFRSEEVLA